MEPAGGRRVNSCLLLAVMAQDAEITTIEGLAAAGRRAPSAAGRVRRARRAAVRVLHARPDLLGGGDARRGRGGLAERGQRQPDRAGHAGRGRDQGADEREPVPLRRLRQHPRRDRRTSTGRRREAVRLPGAARSGRGDRRRDRPAGRGLPGRRDQPGRPDEARRRSARPARRRDRAAARPDRAGARRRAADRRGGAQQRPGRRPAGARRVPGAGPGGAGRGVRPAAEHGHGRRQPAAAHPLPVLPGRDQAVQQAGARLGLPGAGRRPPQPGHPGRIAALRGHPSLGHGGGAGGAGRGGARRGARRAAGDPARRAVPAARRPSRTGRPRWSAAT